MLSGSTSIGRRSTEDDSPAPQRQCDEEDEKVEGSHVETPGKRSIPEPVLKSTVGESVFYVCEVFSPPRIMRSGIPEGIARRLEPRCVEHVQYYRQEVGLQKSWRPSRSEEIGYARSTASAVSQSAVYVVQ